MAYKFKTAEISSYTRTLNKSDSIQIYIAKTKTVYFNLTSEQRQKPYIYNYVANICYRIFLT